MDVSKLAIFLDTVSMGSMKKAAEKYNYTQGGMFYLINSIEQDIGLNITTRDHKGISWNQAGRELEPYFKRLVETDRDVMDKIEALVESKRKNVTIGAYPSVASLILPEVMNLFMTKRRDASTALRMGHHELLGWLDSGEIDFAVMRKECCKSEDYEWLPLMSLQTYAAIPAAFLEGKPCSIRMEEFKQFPFLNSTSNPMNEAISKDSPSESGAKICVSSLDGLGTLRLVAQGLGATSITGLYKDVCPPNVVMLPFDPPVVHDYYVVRRYSPYSKPLVEAFVEILREYCLKFYTEHV